MFTLGIAIVVLCIIRILGQVIGEKPNGILYDVCILVFMLLYYTKP